MEEATVRAAELAAEAGVLGGAALPGAAKESGAADPKLGPAVVPDAGGAEDCGVLRPPNENPANTVKVTYCHSKHCLLTGGIRDWEGYAGLADLVQGGAQHSAEEVICRSSAPVG